MRIMSASRCAFVKASSLRGTPLTINILTLSVAFQPSTALALASFRLPARRQFSGWILGLAKS